MNKVIAKFSVLFLASVLLVAGATVGLAQDKTSFKVGDEVEYWQFAWYTGTIVEVGSGNNQGQYLIKSPRYNNPYWILAKNVRAVSKTKPGTKADAISPRAGKYGCYAQGTTIYNRIFLYYLTLQNGQYTLSTGGGGRYSYDAASHSVRWLTGLHKEKGFTGAFDVEREGKTHKIILLRGTYCTNNSDQ